MTEAAFFGKIRSSLRSAFRYWIPAKQALDRASRPYKGPNKRLKKEFQCAICKNWFKRADVEIDHIVGCGSLKDWNDLIPFIQRLTPENTDAFQVLCRVDHLTKTKNDNKERENAGNRSIPNKKHTKQQPLRRKLSNSIQEKTDATLVIPKEEQAPLSSPTADCE